MPSAKETAAVLQGVKPHPRPVEPIGPADAVPAITSGNTVDVKV
jgi:hypothetical protein